MFIIDNKQVLSNKGYMVVAVTMVKLGFVIVYEEEVMKNKYNEILRLKKMLEDAGIPFKSFELHNGLHLFSEDFTEEEIDKGWSVIEHDGSYGREQDLLEIAGEILKKGDAAIDDVLGYVSAKNAFLRISQFEDSKKDGQI